MINVVDTLFLRLKISEALERKKKQKKKKILITYTLSIACQTNFHKGKRNAKATK